MTKVDELTAQLDQIDAAIAAVHKGMRRASRQAKALTSGDHDKVAAILEEFPNLTLAAVLASQDELNADLVKHNAARAELIPRLDAARRAEVDEKIRALVPKHRAAVV